MIIGRSLAPLNSSRTLRGVRRREMVHPSDDNSRLNVQNVRGDSSAVWAIHPRGKDKWVAVLEAYFDESGIHDGSKYCIVAGYVGSARQ
jgi:hypothetical protein